MAVKLNNHYLLRRVGVKVAGPKSSHSKILLFSPILIAWFLPRLVGIPKMPCDAHPKAPPNWLLNSNLWAIQSASVPSPGSFENATHARRELFAYIESYDNTYRKHSALKYRTPAQFEAA